jgi:hypothetical protein
MIAGYPLSLKIGSMPFGESTNATRRLIIANLSQSAAKAQLPTEAHVPLDVSWTVPR